MTKRAGVIGHPLAHSKSPEIFNAAFEAAGIDATYEAWDTPSDTLDCTLQWSDPFGAATDDYDLILVDEHDETLAAGDNVQSAGVDPIERIDIRREELDQLLERARIVLNEEDYRKLKATVDALSYLTELVADRETTIRDLRQLLLPPSTEKTREVLKKAGIEETPKLPETTPTDQSADKKPGHGRNGANAYEGAQKIAVEHEKLKVGDRCPGCWKGQGVRAAGAESGGADRGASSHRRDPFTNSSDYAATFAARCIPLRRRKAWVRTSTTNQQRR